MKKITLVFDAGHGGKDKYNRGYSERYVEADGNLQFVLFLNYYLKDYFNVVLTRKKDKTMSLTERGRMAKDADMFISFHSDAYTKTSSGVTVFDSVDLDNTLIGEKVGMAVASAMKIRFNGVRERESAKYRGEDYYTVIDVAQDIGCPVVLLVERGFHSNPVEEKKLLDDKIVRESAKSVADVIKHYYGIESDHWANPFYESLNSKGIVIHEKRFDDKLTRGEFFAVIDQIIDKLKE